MLERRLFTDYRQKNCIMESQNALLPVGVKFLPSFALSNMRDVFFYLLLTGLLCILDIVQRGLVTTLCRNLDMDL
jgi:hypothetical protein